MAIEQEERGYYNKIATSKNYIDMTRSLQVAAWDYISKVFFGGDYKRVLYTNPEYAFRKRIEYLAKGIDGDIYVNNLNLPFASFYSTGYPKIIKSVSASMWHGYYDEIMDQRFHFYGINQTFNVQFYFYRSDDLRIAHTMALAESHSKAPVRYIEETYWRNKILSLPVFMTIKEIKVGNESFNESQWLTQNHMYAMTLSMEMESVQIHINKGLNAIQLPFKWHNTGIQDTWEDGTKEYYTQKCTLLFANKFLGLNMHTPRIYDNPPEPVKIQFEMMAQKPYRECDERTLKQIASVLPSDATAEMIEGVFTEPVQITYNRLLYNKDKTTIDKKGEVTAWIDTIVKPSTYQYWKEVLVITPTRGRDNPIKIEDCHQDHVLIDGLHPNSNYKIFFIARDINDGMNTIELDFTTPVWEKEPVPGATVEGEGISENNPVIPPAKDVPFYGLIGMGGEYAGDVDKIDLTGLEL